MPHLNNKAKLQTQSSADRITISLSLAHQRKNKQTNKNSAKISPYTKLTQTTGPTLGGQKPKGRKNSTLKPRKRRFQTEIVKNNIMKRQRNTTQMKEQIRNTEVQINEEEIGKLPEK